MRARIGLVMLSIGAVVLAGCGSSGSTGSGLAVGYVSPVAAQPSQQQVRTGMEAAAESLGWNITVLDANLSADRQVSHVDTLISQGSKAIAAWSLDPNALAGAYTRAQAAHIPVIGFNSSGTGVTTTVWWEVNTCEPGGPYERTATWIAARKPGAKVIVFGGPPVETITNNVACFTAAARSAGLTVLGRTDNVKDTSAAAATLAADELTKHPDVEVFWAYNDNSALGISAALQSANKPVYSAATPDGVMVIGSNADAEAVQAVREGRITATWDPNPRATGYALISAMKAALDNPATTPKLITVRSTMYTKENIGEYVEPAQRSYRLDDLPLVTG